MRSDRSHTPVFFTTIGTSSLLVVFLVLCLATFAVLSLSGARNEAALAERCAERKSAYYQAVSQAERVLDTIDQSLAASEAEETDAAGALLSLNDGALSGTPLSPMSAEDGLPRFSFSVPTGDSEILSVEFVLQDSYYTLTCWQLVHTSDREYDTAGTEFFQP